MSYYIGLKCSMHLLRFCEKKYPSNGFFEGENWDHLMVFFETQ